MNLLYRTSVFFLTLIMASTAMATIHTVNAFNFFYSPSSLSIASGDTVRFQWAAGSHPTSSTSGDWAAFVFFQLNASQPAADLVFANPGTYNYQCDFHASIGMVGSITVSGPPPCSTVDAPTFQSHTNFSNRVRLTWIPQNSAVACQLQAKQLPTGPQPKINLLGPVISIQDIPYTSVPAGSMWTWRVRCACSTTPLLVSPYTAYGDTFSIPVAREMESAQSEMIVYPNPAQDQLQVQFESVSGGSVNLSIFDLTGRLMESQVLASNKGLNKISIDVSHYRSGVYFLRMGERKPIAFDVLR